MGSRGSPRLQRAWNSVCNLAQGEASHNTPFVVFCARSADGANDRERRGAALEETLAESFRYGSPPRVDVEL